MISKATKGNTDKFLPYDLVEIIASSDVTRSDDDGQKKGQKGHGYVEAQYTLWHVLIFKFSGLRVTFATTFFQHAFEEQIDSSTYDKKKYVCHDIASCNEKKVEFKYGLLREFLSA